MARPQPGLAFALPSDAGYVVGIVTHHVPRVASLVWIAGPTFDDEPTVEDVRGIATWRWPVLLPLEVAIRRHVVNPIGMVPVDKALLAFPTMRSGNRKAGWTAFTEIGGVRRQLGSTKDRDLPIYQVVNDVRLKEMVVSGWRPDDVW
jgi:hypothetical protein